MDKCRRCNVSVNGNVDNCPLCGAHIQASPSVFDYPAEKRKDKNGIFIKICMFVSLMAIAVCLIVDLAVNHTVSWSWHVIFGVALIALSIIRPILLRFNVRKYVSWIFAGILALLFYLNGWIDNFENIWAFRLGAPIAVIVWQVVLAILFFAHKSERPEYEMSLTKICILSFICIGISFACFKNCTWGWYVCAGLGAMHVIAMIIFLNRSYFGELKRRLHV